jgi:hypothetical protein
LNSATASMKSAWKGISSGKVHPSWYIHTGFMYPQSKLYVT